MNRLVSKIVRRKFDSLPLANGKHRREASGLLMLSFLFVVLCGAPSSVAAQECSVYGPKTVTMTADTPVLHRESFMASAPSGTHTIVVQNGNADGTQRVSSGEIRVGGIQVIKESDFNQNIGEIRKNFTIPANGAQDGTQFPVVVEIELKGGANKNSASPPLVVVRIVRIVTESDGPAITITQPTQGRITDASSITVSGTVTDASGVKTLTVNGNAAQLAGNNFTAQVALAPGSNTINVTAADCAGSTSTRTLTVIYDTAPPTLSNLSPANNSLTRTPTVQVRGTVADDAGISGVTINNQPAALSGNEFAADIALVEGANNINIVATDVAGRQASVAITTVLDTVAPTLTITSPPAGARTTQNSVDVAGEASDANGIASISINGNPISLVDNRFTQATALQAGDNAITVVATDLAGNTTTATALVNRVEFTPLTISITTPAPQSLVSTGFVTVTGLVDVTATSVSVNGVTGAIIGGAFTAENVPLHEGVNILTATASKGANGINGTGSASVSISLDTSSPTVRIDSPTDGAVLTSSTVNVTGMVNDVVSGTVNAEQATITVNGLAATVSNRTFVASNLLLVRGMNTLTAIARDPAGNESRHQIRVNVQDAAGQQKLVKVSGDDQTGIIGTTLGQPLVVQLLDAGGNAIPNRPVTFTVRRSDGVIRALPQEGQEVTVTSDAEGRASAQFQLGTRSGVGNNIVSVTSSGFTGEAMFSHSATVSPAVHIHGAMVMGESSIGIVGKSLPMPFDVIVTDAGGNPVADVPVTFKVEQGGGQIEGQTVFIKNTNTDGKVSVLPVLGEQEGISNNVFSASFTPTGSNPGAETNPSVYLKASGLVQGAASDTRVSGVVLDNQNRPIPHAHAKIVGRDDLFAYTNDQGQFSIPNAPVGTITLIVDGSTTTRPEKFPFLAFMMMNIAGQDNTVGMPIFIPFLDTEGIKNVGGNEDVVLTMKGVPGVAFTVFANSAKKPDGTKYVGPMSLTQVHADKVPMPPPNGTAPKVVWTLQPAGLHFDKPIQVQLPNTDGLTPGQVIEVFSFDHALEQFVSGGMARVSPDSSVIVSDPGFGIHVSGWGAPAPPPPPDKCVASCDDKNPCTADRCVRGACQNTPVSEGSSCEGTGGCFTGKCTSGVCQPTQQSPAGSSCDDKDFCTDNDKCDAGGACKGDKKKEEIVPPGIKFEKTLGDTAFTKIILSLLQKLKVAEKVELKISVNGVQKRVCCAEKKTTVMNRSLSVAGDLDVTIKEVKPPGLTIGIPFTDISLGAYVKGKVKGTLFVAPLAHNACKEKWEGSGGGSVAVEIEAGFKGQATDSVEVTPIAAKAGAGIVCVAQGVEGGLKTRCNGKFNGVVLKAEAKWFNKKIEIIDWVVFQPSDLGTYEDTLIF
jgi:hypothetical protein